MDRPVITFTDSVNGKEKKQWDCCLTEACNISASPALQAMIKSALELWEGFTLEELAENAITEHGLKTKTTDMNALGYTHRPKLMELKIIVASPTEAVPVTAEFE